MATAGRKTTNLNMARVDPGKLNSQIVQSLPGDLVADLTDAFQFYDKTDEGYISMQHFRNILHNFSFHKLGKKETDEELKKADPDFLKRNAIDFPTVKYVIAYRWSKSGS